jgi:uncharacterized cysteine cluster protein YcgN (CxxCxxCC family)
MIHGYNVIIDFQPCKHLNVDTGLCKIYKDRFAIPHCANGKAKFYNGNLPKECLYLKEHPELEPNPKVNVQDVVTEFNAQEVMLYNTLINQKNLWARYYEVNGY